MALIPRAARASAMRIAERAGLDETARRVWSTFDPAQRRDLADHRAMHLLLATHLRADSHAIDVGVNEGDVLRRMQELTPDGRVVGFEPIPELHADLVRRYPRADVINAAASDVEGDAIFHHVTSGSGFSGLQDRGTSLGHTVKQIRVRTTRLDDALPEGLAPAFLKVDVEGAELQVFRGAIRTLLEHRPVVLFEHGAGAADLYGTTSGAVWDLLCGEVGLRLFDLEGNGPFDRPTFESLFLEPVWNWVAVP